MRFVFRAEMGGVRKIDSESEPIRPESSFEDFGLRSEMGKTRIRIGVGVWWFLSDSEWSRSALFVNLLESESSIKFQNRNQK